MSQGLIDCKRILLNEARLFTPEVFEKLREDPDVLRATSLFLLYMSFFAVLAQFVPHFVPVVGLTSHVLLVMIVVAFNAL